MRLRQEKSDISYQIQKAVTDMQNAQHNAESSKENYTLSQTIYKNQQQQFVIGVIRYSDLLDTEKSLSNAKQNYIKALYDYLVAEIAYEKSIGSF